MFAHLYTQRIFATFSARLYVYAVLLGLSNVRTLVGTAAAPEAGREGRLNPARQGDAVLPGQRAIDLTLEKPELGTNLVKL